MSGRIKKPRKQRREVRRRGQCIEADLRRNWRVQKSAPVLTLKMIYDAIAAIQERSAKATAEGP